MLQTQQTPVVTSEGKEEETDYNLLKILILAILGASFALGSAYFFQQFTLGARYVLLLWSALLSIGFFAFVILNAFFIKKPGKTFIITILQVAIILLPFYKNLYPKPAPLLLISAAIFWFFLFIAILRGQRVLKNSIHIQFFPVARLVLPRAVTGFLIFLTITMYLSYFSWGMFTDAIGKKFLFGILDSSESTLHLWFPDLSFNLSVGDFLLIITKAQMKKLPLAEMSMLPPQVKEAAARQASEALKTSLENAVGPLNTKETAEDALYRIVKNYVTNLSPMVLAFGGVALTVGIFLTLKGTIVLFYWLIEIIALILFKIFIVTGFAKMSIEARSREFILLK